VSELPAYATLADFERVYPAAAYGDRVNPSQRQQALVDASREADSYIGDKVNLPLQALAVPPNPYPFDRQLTRAVCKIAAWNCLALRGFNPDNPADVVVRTGYDDALKWLTRVANGQASIRWQQQETPTPSLQPDISTNCQRGYGAPGIGTDPPFISGQNNN